MAPYAGEPQDLRPYARFEKPYYENYLEPNIYMAPAATSPIPKDIKEVRIGFLGPLDPSPDKADGEHMLHGAQLAVEEANARGGYGGKPFKLMVHNDYNNWQAKAVYGSTRPTDEGIWGSAGDEAVKMIYDDQGLGHLRVDQLGKHAYHAARCAQSRDPDCQLRFDRSDHSRDVLFPGTLPTCRTTACRPIRWLAMSIPILASSVLPCSG